jgi:hypothetical protein
LESLNEVSGTESFILAVDPNDPTDEGFLGGSLAGRDFWRGLRGGGTAGARGFKTFCGRRLPSQQQNHHSLQVGDSGARPSSAISKSGPARSVKNDLYDAVRTSLRYAVFAKC